MEAYGSWRQIAGYFDGDGNVSISDMSDQPFKLRLSLIFTDGSPEQIYMIRTFFLNRGIRPSNVLKTSKGTASMIAISRFDGVLTAMKAMLPYLFKKANEALAVIDYYEGRTSGNDLIAIFQQEVTARRREKHNHRVKIDVPYTYPEGDLLMKARRRQRIRDVIYESRAKITERDYDSIRREHLEYGSPLSDLIRAYPQYARETIRRILGRGRGYVLVKGRGLFKNRQ